MPTSTICTGYMVSPVEEVEEREATVHQGSDGQCVPAPSKQHKAKIFAELVTQCQVSSQSKTELSCQSR